MQRHRLSEILGDMSDEAYNALRADIESNGFMNPEILRYEGLILDGWHRYCVAQELDIVEKLVFLDIADDDTAVMRVLSNNLHRRHLTPSQRAQIVVETHKWYEHGGDRQSVIFNAPRGALKSKTELAGIADDRAKKVSRAGFAEKVISGERKATDIIREEKTKATAQKHEELINHPSPEGVYPIIVIDPSDKNFEALGKIELPLTDDAFVFIWATQQNVPDTYKLLEVWGLRYRFMMVWQKTKGSEWMNHPWSNGEFIVVGAKGGPRFANRKDFNTVFQANEDAFSGKPDNFYSTIRCVTHPPRLSMYNPKEIIGFDPWPKKV